MDFLHAVLPALQERVFFAVASLLDLEVDLLFFDYPADLSEDEFDDDDVFSDESVFVFV